MREHDSTPTHSTGTGLLTWRRATWLVGALSVFSYLNTLPNDFCDDGQAQVALNDKVNQPGGWKAIWSTDYWSQTKESAPVRDLLYRPVALSSYRIVNAAFGVHPMPHHVVNILLHALAAVLLLRLLFHLGVSIGVTAVAGLTFAVLPIHTGVLNNIVGRGDLLATVGTLAALLFHQRLMRAESIGKATGWYVLAALTAFIAMGSKESGVALVALVPFFDLYWHRTRGDESQTRSTWLSGRTLLRLSWIVVPLATYFGLRYWALSGELYQRPALTKTVNVLVDAPPWQHALGVVQLWGMYWAKTLWPQVLCVNYTINAIRLATSVFDFHVFLGLAVTVGMVWLCVDRWRRGSREPTLIVLALVIAWLPTSNALVLMQVFFAERTWYLPSVWACVLIGMVVAPLLKRPLWVALFGIVVLGMVGRCWIRSGEWRHNGTLYASAYRDHPDSVGARYLYGWWLARNTDDPETLAFAIERLQGALDIDPGYTDAQRALGRAYLKAGDAAKAVQYLQIADMQVPGHPPTEEALRIASQRLAGAQESALTDLRDEANGNPGHLPIQIALVRRLRDVGLINEALAHLKKHEDRFTDSGDWQYEFAVTLVMKNRLDDAIERYRRCIDLQPAKTGTIIELGMLLIERRERGDLAEATSLCDAASEQAPNDPRALVCRAEIAALRGDLDQAARAYESAIRMVPPGSNLHRSWSERKKALGG